MQLGAHGLGSSSGAPVGSGGSVSRTGTLIVFPSWSVLKHTPTDMDLFAQIVFLTPVPNPSGLLCWHPDRGQPKVCSRAWVAGIQTSYLTGESQLKFTCVHTASKSRDCIHTEEVGLNERVGHTAVMK